MMLTIGEAASALGVETHVLRHWDDVGVVTPARAPSGHRRYDADDVDRARLVQRLQRAGLSLSEIGLLLRGDRRSREGVVAARLAALAAQVAEARAAMAFLEHTRECRHRMVAPCPGCRDYAGACGVTPPPRPALPGSR